jgi:predicted Ser/Thr protein kinase
MSLTPDVSLADRYHLEQRIAIGGMGEVWRARDAVLGRIVAVKVLKPEFAADPDFLARFRNEARHTASLSHPGIANVYDYGEIGDVAYLVMEYVEGEPLSTVLAREGRLSPEQALDIVGQTGLALQAAHEKGVIHRDVKPGNLLLRPDGVVKVTDFGIARAVDAVPVTKTGLVVGTAAYLSPEQAGGRPVTPASDVYSLGVVTYECLTGGRPFVGDSAVGVAMAHLHNDPPPMTDVPTVVADFVRQSLEKDPARRHPSAGDFGRTALALAASLRAPQAGTADETTHLAGTGARHDTKLLTTVSPEADAPVADHEPTYDESQRRRVRNIFIAVGAVVVILGFLLLRACGSTTYASVPGVTGLSYPRAAALLDKAGFTAARHTVHDARHAAGLVLGEDPTRGSRLATGSTVTLTVASGPLDVTINPSDYIGKPVAQVRPALQALNLHVSVVSKPSTQPAGTVTAMDQSGSVREGTTVTLTVAAQPAPAPGKDHGKRKGGHGD